MYKQHCIIHVYREREREGESIYIHTYIYIIYSKGHAFFSVTKQRDDAFIVQSTLSKKNKDFTFSLPEAKLSQI